MSNFDWIEKIPAESWTRRNDRRYVMIDSDEFMARSGSSDFHRLQHEFKEWREAKPAKMYLSLAMVDGEPWAVAISRDVA